MGWNQQSALPSVMVHSERPMQGGRDREISRARWSATLTLGPGDGANLKKARWTTLGIVPGCYVHTPNMHTGISTSQAAEEYMYKIMTACGLGGKEAGRQRWGTQEASRTTAESRI